LHRLFDQNIENRLKLTGRGIDDPQHFGDRLLLLQRLARLGDQPGIFDRNDRLVGERTDQLDLPLGERFGPLPSQRYSAQRFSLHR